MYPGFKLSERRDALLATASFSLPYSRSRGARTSSQGEQNGDKVVRTRAPNGAEKTSISDDEIKTPPLQTERNIEKLYGRPACVASAAVAPSLTRRRNIKTLRRPEEPLRKHARRRPRMDRGTPRRRARLAMASEKSTEAMPPAPACRKTNTTALRAALSTRSVCAPSSSRFAIDEAELIRSVLSLPIRRL